MGIPTQRRALLIALAITQGAALTILQNKN